MDKKNLKSFILVMVSIWFIGVVVLVSKGCSNQEPEEESIYIKAVGEIDEFDVFDGIPLVIMGSKMYDLKTPKYVNSNRKISRGDKATYTSGGLFYGHLSEEDINQYSKPKPFKDVLWFTFMILVIGGLTYLFSKKSIQKKILEKINNGKKS